VGRLDEVDAASTRHHDVEQHQIVVLLLKLPSSAGEVLGGVDQVPLGAQRALNALPDTRLVVDN
jgi:hypothetical protein